MGVNEKEKVELAAYQFKDVAHVWYKNCSDGRVGLRLQIKGSML